MYSCNICYVTSVNKLGYVIVKLYVNLLKLILIFSGVKLWYLFYLHTTLIYKNSVGIC